MQRATRLSSLLRALVPGHSERSRASEPLRQCLILQQETISSPQLQVEPLLSSARTLRRRGWKLRVTVAANDAEKLRAVHTWSREPRLGAVMLQADWRAPAEQVLRLVEQMREVFAAAPAAPVLVFLDHSDGATSPHVVILSQVDVFVKKQLPHQVRDMAIAPGEGGALAGYFRTLYEKSPPPVVCPAALRAIEEHGHKLCVGWNVGSGNFIRDWLFTVRLNGSRRVRRAAPFTGRDIDIHCRVGLSDHGYEDWYRRHRRACLAVLEKLSARYSRVLGASGGDIAPPVPLAQYRRELAATRICVSPFGYGEICYRDYEAVAAGCLLAKPDVSHLRTAPDIFVPHETYVPFRWDLSDLLEALDPYLSDPTRAEALAQNARRRLAAYFEQQEWIEPFLKSVRLP